MKARKWLVALVTLLSLSSLIEPSDVRAAWYLFTVSGPDNTPVAQVAEQIVPAQFNVNGGAALGLDYIYRVRNIGAKAIQDFWGTPDRAARRGDATDLHGHSAGDQSGIFATVRTDWQRQCAVSDGGGEHIFASGLAVR